MTHPSRIFVLLLLTLLGIAPVAWAGAAEEVAEVVKQRAQWAQEGNLDEFMTTYADNAVITPGRFGLRAEGKAAIRAFFANAWQTYPTRRTLGRHSMTRIYGNDTIAIINNYGDQTFLDKSGLASTATMRSTTTFVKIGGKWLVVDQHNSRMP
ncbi:MAG: YybH family protein [Candidatus Methylomirabilales bacterium]